jgi:hypothetical protein
MMTDALLLARYIRRLIEVGIVPPAQVMAVADAIEKEAKPKFAAITGRPSNSITYMSEYIGTCGAVACRCCRPDMTLEVIERCEFFKRRPSPTCTRLGLCTCLLDSRLGLTTNIETCEFFK